MPGTMTAPVASAITNTSSSMTIHLIDASGDLHSENISGAADALVDLTEVAAIQNQYQLSTNASIWKVSQTLEWEGVRDADNALALYRANAESGINLTFRNPTTIETLGNRVIAPVAAIMQGNQDIPLLATPLDDLVTALLAVYAGFSLESMQYTGRRERSNNPRVRV